MTSPQDPQLLERLLGEHGAALELYAAQWTTSPQDCVQEAFLQLVRQRKLPRRVVPWLYRVVRNRAISMARSAQRRKKHESRAAEFASSWLVAERDSAVDAVEAAEALAALSLRHREVIVARLWGGLTLEQIAEVTGTSVGSAHRRYQAGLQTLRERLGLPCPSQRSSTAS